MNAELEKLFDALYSDNEAIAPAAFIKIVEKNLNILESEHIAEDLEKAWKILGDYAVYLYERGSYKNALPYLEKIIAEIEKKNNDPFENELFEELIFHRALANHHLKAKSKAKKDFKLLAQKFPENDVYRKWIKFYKSKIFRYFEIAFTILLAISITFSIILKPEDGIIDSIALYGAFISLFGGIISLILRKVITK
ncbi:MAG: hypothetical protein C0592_06840 [Marinilabiliales bacterium]|nr:MAG: hypothetical protein C0592_06840 [Marinilabiliales bacterium]